MSGCIRFESEGLARLEEGLDLDEHFDDCGDCRRAREAYERIKQNLGSIGDDEEPGGDWRTRVRERIESRAKRRRTRIRAAAAFLTAAAVLVALVIVRDAGSPEPLTITVNVEEADGTLLRGEQARPGDRLVIAATVPEAQEVELRVYRDDHELVLSCSSGPPCERSEKTLNASLILPAVGEYQTVLFVSSKPLSVGDGSLDKDAGRALEAGASVRLGAVVTVR